MLDCQLQTHSLCYNAFLNVIESFTLTSKLFGSKTTVTKDTACLWSCAFMHLYGTDFVLMIRLAAGVMFGALNMFTCMFLYQEMDGGAVTCLDQSPHREESKDKGRTRLVGGTPLTANDISSSQAEEHGNRLTVSCCL